VACGGWRELGSSFGGAVERREKILAEVSDLVADFLYYGRKDDEDLPRGAIESALAAGELSLDELVGAFKTELEDNLK
jgi:hypothetical protein